MKSNWETRPLGTLGVFRNGVNFSRSQEGSGVPILKVKNFGDLVICPLHGLDELNAAAINIPTSQLLRDDDIVIVRSNGNSALVGRSVLVRGITRSTTFTGFCIRFRLTDKSADAQFLAYAIRSPLIRDRLSRFGSGTGIQNLNQTILSELPLDLPRLFEQRAIASVLGALDDKIEQNRRTAGALERLARAIFRAWFVDFEPVKAKAAGAESFPSMPQQVFDHLPAHFDDSDIGPVPKGWKVQAIAEIATFLNGLALQKYPPRGDGCDLRIIKIAQLRKGSTEGAHLANGDVPEKYVINDRDLLFSWSGTLEAEFWFGGKGALNQHLFKVTSSRFPSWFCLLWIRQHLPWFRAIAASKATTMGHIKRGHLQEAQVVVPAADVFRAADAVIGPLYDLHAQLMVESRKLECMRDLLLPGLLSRTVHVVATEEREGE